MNKLTDDCLIRILSEFSLQRRIHLRIVCRRWTNLIERLCSRKISLKLFSTKDDIYYYLEYLMKQKLQMDSRFLLKPIGLDDHLVIQNDCVKLGQLLQKIFVNVQHIQLDLSFFRRDQSCFADQKFWLRFQSLQTITLYGNLRYAEPRLQLFNSLINLKQLNLLVYQYEFALKLKNKTTDDDSTIDTRSIERSLSKKKTFICCRKRSFARSLQHRNFRKRSWRRRTSWLNRKSSTNGSK
ncbi:hypothetical protein RDWZM_006359 [Blomia tropicalis]|uniref:F-box domain-containing protein n=1 Tax=Blomia tropicalis TaxID=40697 RepID=A0A9Q0MAC4_BLOTA|nr:hypothetical protein RDWZM_006359 [Blomia tropicalis]